MIKFCNSSTGWPKHYNPIDKHIEMLWFEYYNNKHHVRKGVLRDLIWIYSSELIVNLNDLKIRYICSISTKTITLNL